MAAPVSGYLGYDPLADRPLVKLKSGTKKLLTEDDSGGGSTGPHAATHEAGGSDPITGTLASPQIPDRLRYPFTLRAVNTGQLSPDEIGVLQFNGADFPSHTKTLVVNLEVATSGQLATLELFNLTDGSTVTTVTSSSLVTEKKTATVTLPAADKLYGLRLSRAGGSTGDRVSCRSAALELRA